jgi:hypothetical protein
MKTLLKTNDPVLLDFAGALLRDAGIKFEVFDGAMSVMDGSIGALPRRLTVLDEDEEKARTLLRDGLGAAELEV